MNFSAAVTSTLNRKTKYSTVKVMKQAIIILGFLYLIKISQASEYEDALKTGIIFHKDSQILLAEKFINAEFLVPFPKYSFTIQDNVTQLLSVLSTKWKSKSTDCSLNFAKQLNASVESFNVDWILRKLQSEVQLAQDEVSSIKVETSHFLFNEAEENRSRRRRGAPLALATLAGVGLFGPGILMDDSSSCGLLGIFGTCQDKSRENAKNIKELHEYTIRLTEYVAEYEEQVNEKFFLVADKLSEVNNIQKEMIKNQQENWKVIEDQFTVIKNNFEILRDCDQYLFSNQQLNFNFDTAASLLSLLYSDVKSYRAALYAFKTNIMNAIPTLLDKRLTMSLVPRNSLIAILNSVYESQKDAADRLTLAIPTTDLHSYYDAKLLRDVVTVDEGLLMTLAIPMSSSLTVFSVYRAHLIPMPQPEQKDAIKWKTDGDYFAISENGMETSVLTREQYEMCLGSSTYRICHQTMETQLGRSSCLANLFWPNPVATLTVCETEKVILPTPEKATNLGYGIWLITSASSSFSLWEYNLNEVHTPSRKEHPGCNICIITLDCRTQLASRNIKIRPDLGSCDKIPARRIDVKLSDPLKHLMSEIPGIDEIPYFKSRTDAGIRLLEEVKAKLVDSPIVTNMEQLDEISKPIAHGMKLLKPSFTEKLESYVPIKLSLTLTVIVFIGSTLLQCLCTYLFHRFKAVRDITPRFLKTAHGDIRIKPVVAMDIDESERDEKTTRLMESREEWQNKYTVLDVIDETVSVPQQRRQIDDGMLNDEARSMRGSKMDMARSRSFSEIPGDQRTTSRHINGEFKLTPNSGILGMKPPSVEIGAQYTEQAA